MANKDNKMLPAATEGHGIYFLHFLLLLLLVITFKIYSPFRPVDFLTKNPLNPKIIFRSTDKKNYL